MEIELKCSECGAPLKARFDDRSIPHRGGSVDISIEPCEMCLDKAHADGADEGAESRDGEFDRLEGAIEGLETKLADQDALADRREARIDELEALLRGEEVLP